MKWQNKLKKNVTLLSLEESSDIPIVHSKSQCWGTFIVGKIYKDSLVSETIRPSVSLDVGIYSVLAAKTHDCALVTTRHLGCLQHKILKAYPHPLHEHINLIIKT